jgi:hypothetical protein
MFLSSSKIKPENVLMCVDEEHVRALASQAAEWHKPGMKPVGSAGSFVRSFKNILDDLSTHEHDYLFSSGNGAYYQ